MRFVWLASKLCTLSSQARLDSLGHGGGSFHRVTCTPPTTHSLDAHSDQPQISSRSLLLAAHARAPGGRFTASEVAGLGFVCARFLGLDSRSSPSVWLVKQGTRQTVLINPTHSARTYSVNPVHACGKLEYTASPGSSDHPRGNHTLFLAVFQETKDPAGKTAKSWLQ